MSYPNLDLLESAAAKLRPLLPEIVFVGGCATGLLITDPGAAAVRRTYDVDVITEIASYAEYAVFSERLRELGFAEDSREGACSGSRGCCIAESADGRFIVEATMRAMVVVEVDPWLELSVSLV